MAALFCVLTRGTATKSAISAKRNVKILRVAGDKTNTSCDHKPHALRCPGCTSRPGGVIVLGVPVLSTIFGFGGAADMVLFCVCFVCFASEVSLFAAMLRQFFVFWYEARQ